MWAHVGAKPPGPASSCLLWEIKPPRLLFAFTVHVSLTPRAPFLDPSCSEASTEVPQGFMCHRRASKSVPKPRVSSANMPWGWAGQLKPERKGNKTQNIKGGVGVAYTLLSLTHARTDLTSMQVILYSQKDEEI